MKLKLAFVLLCVSFSVNAAPVTWYLQNVLENGQILSAGDSYGDGANYYSVTGSFDYDADTNTYSSVNIVTQFNTFTDADLVLPFFLDSQHLKLTGDAGLVLSLASGMTNAGGTINLVTGFAGIDCFVTECGSVEETGVEGKYYLAGSITSVPIPAAVWLFGSGLGLLGWFRRKQS